VVVAQYLLTFREVFEAAILSAIILGFLLRSGRAPMTRYAWYGIATATAVSVVVGSVIWLVYGSLSASSRVLFEVVAAFLAVAVLTSMILWMALKGRALRKEVEVRVEAAVTQGAIIGIFSLTFVLVVREGIETILFLAPFLLDDVLGTVIGASLGAAFGVALAYGVFRLGLKLDIRKFFFFTSLLLILLAGGLLGYGVHEFIEYLELQGVDLGWWAQPAFVLGVGSDSVFHHRGAIGAILAVMFGYTVSAEWARVIAHAAYLAIFLPLVILIYVRPQSVERAVRRIRAVFRPAAAPEVVPRNP